MSLGAVAWDTNGDMIVGTGKNNVSYAEEHKTEIIKTYVNTTGKYLVGTANKGITATTFNIKNITDNYRELKNANFLVVPSLQGMGMNVFDQRYVNFSVANQPSHSYNASTGVLSVYSGRLTDGGTGGYTAQYVNCTCTVYLVGINK